MGQLASTDIPNSHKQSFKKTEIIDFFHKKCKLLLTPTEISALSSKINSTSLNEKNVLTPSDLAYLLQVSVHKNDDIDLMGKNFSNCIKMIYNSIKILACFPFISEVELSCTTVTMDDVIVAGTFYSGRYRRLLPVDWDYSKLCFISLCGDSLEEFISDKRLSNSMIPDDPSNNEKLASNARGKTATVTVLNEPEDAPVARRILWKTLGSILNLDQIDVSEIQMSAYDLHQLLTLFLICTSITKSQRKKMQQELLNLLKGQWGDFEDVALSLMKHIRIDLDSENLSLSYLSFDDVFNSEFTAVSDLINDGFKTLFKEGFFSSLFGEETTEVPDDLQTKRKHPAFEDSKLMNSATVAAVGRLLKGFGSDIAITKENLVKLYIGREAGFSIRSLELKIFKWQAPTLFIVSGKRLRQKTASSNKRYLEFDNEYPRYYLSLENHLQPWQKDSDRITYGVLVTSPWKISNKKNFGNEDCMIFSLKPHIDYYPSSRNPILGTDLIYFNTLGLGLGFGNDQPLDKNGIKKYLPGDVSLTIESNLEFAVFRHVSSTKGSLFFDRSKQVDLSGKDFEDRFIITDLEVWGVGSTKELEQQKKQWEWEQKQAEARRSVNVNRLGEDRAFMEMVGMVGNWGGGGSI